MVRWRIAAVTSIVSLSLPLAGPSRASETLTYSYDALGRLTQVGRSGAVNNGASESYSYDPAGNRTNVAGVVISGGAPVSPSLVTDSPPVADAGTSSVPAADTAPTVVSPGLNDVTASDSSSSTYSTAAVGTPTSLPATPQ